MSASRSASRRSWRSRRDPGTPDRPRRAPTVVVGMGHPLMGDVGVGWALARRLADHPRLPPDVYVAWGGTDLLAAASLLDGRSRVVLLEA